LCSSSSLYSRASEHSMRRAFILPLFLGVMALGGYGALSVHLRSQDTSFSGYMSGLLLNFWGGEENQLIRVNLHNYSLALYEDGDLYKVTRIATPGNPGDGTRTPTGKFRILSKDKWHVSGSIVMPWSLRFNGPYYFHDIPLIKATGEIIRTRYSHGCIRLPTGFAEEMFNWAHVGAYVEIYNATLARADDSPAVYLLTVDGYRQPIASEREFLARGYRWQDVAVLPSAELAAIPLLNAGQ
jgi:hypothetical protein